VDPTIIVVLVTLLADIVTKVLSTKKNSQTIEKTAEAVKELKTLAEQQMQISSAINRRVEVLEHRVAYLENYRPGPEPSPPDPLMDSAWPISRKRRH
jgi:predicted RecB family endonuclease